MDPRTLLAAWLLIALCGGCASQPRRDSRSPQTAQASEAVPRLVISAVFDQLGSDTLDRHLAQLSEDGAIKQAIAHGLYASRVRYTHATSLTAPNHAAIYSGVEPRHSGVTGNLLRTPDGKTRASIDDGRSQVLGGRPDKFAGPGVLKVPTVADVLKRETGGRGKVVSISLKDRAAILPGGQKPDAVLWYDETVPGFTTSTYYAREIPTWLVDFTRRYPIDTLLMPWIPLAEHSLAQHLGPDESAGEGHYLGWDDTFPHNPRESKAPRVVLRLMPALSEYLIALARAAVHAYRLGRDDTPDLLAISISGTDYAGHVFGPDSWEYVDHLIRADAALGALVRELSERIPTAVVITSDHGVSRLPEQLNNSLEGARVPKAALQKAARDAVLADLGERLGGAGPWIDRFASPYLYLTSAAREHPERSAIVAAAIRGLKTVQHTHAAYDARALLKQANTPFERDIAAAIHPETSGEIYVVHAPHSMADIGMVHGAGTTHGSPWDYDREVPGIIAGSGVPRGHISEPVAQPRLTSTLAHLLGIPPPQPDPAPPLY